MKNHAALILALLLLTSVVFTACDKGEKNLEDNKSSVSTNTDSENKSEAGNNNANNSEAGVDDKISSVSDKTNTTSEKDVTSTTTSNNTTSVGGDKNNSKPSTDTTSNNSSNDVGGSDTETMEFLTFEQYLKLTPAEQQNYYKSFNSVEDFADWYKKAQAEYNGSDGSIQVGGDGSFNLGEYID